MTKLAVLLLLIVTMITVSSKSLGKTNTSANSRNDGATKINISLSGSLQNPAFSPDGNYLVFTRFRNGYNKEPADLFVVEIETGTTRTLVSNGRGNINLPGSAWNNTTNKIVFASTRDPHDEIYMIDENGTTGMETQITSRTAYVAYEPSFSPNGDWIVFESHLLDVEGNGIIYKCTVTGTKPYTALTGGADDCRQPNWAPAGNRILYQKLANNRWDIYVMDTDGNNAGKITTGPGDKTDASFSPDGKNIIYSSDEGGEAFANLYSIPVSGDRSTKITNYPTGYDGAPSWSPDGGKIAFESCQGDPDESGGTSIWIIQLQNTVISLSRDRLNFGVISGSITPVSQTFAISSGGSGTLNWEVSEDSAWLECTPGSGSHSGLVTAAVHPADLVTGQYSGTINVSSSSALNSPQSVSVRVNVYEPGSTGPPFGAFATPVDGAAIRSSVAVTGWVLDDVGIESVKIYRNEGTSRRFIGDALLVEGARPDIERSFPGYPFNYKAGWGYMMLTYFLPDGGNGTYILHAAARDLEGNETILGVHTVTCDNVNAVKPFGAIDTPGQGGTASGNFRNAGWVLTPLPNKVPEDGSTIDVYVNGVHLGHAGYNNYRPDIAALFPGYANSGGALAYFDLDTTAYPNGIYTIYWAAADDAGNSDGIGSRYFTIQNTAGRMGHGALSMERGAWGMEQSAACLEPVGIIKGYARDVEPQMLYPDDNGIINIEIKELERLEIQLGDLNSSSFVIHRNDASFYSGYLVVGDQFRSLPIGSTLDAVRGIFYWHPGPGFLGEYRLVFVEKRHAGKTVKRKINVIIKSY